MVMNEFETRDELQEKRRSIKTFVDLIVFLKQVEDIDFDSMDLDVAYGVAPCYCSVSILQIWNNWFPE